VRKGPARQPVTQPVKKANRPTQGRPEEGKAHAMRTFYNPQSRFVMGCDRRCRCVTVLAVMVSR